MPLNRTLFSESEGKALAELAARTEGGNSVTLISSLSDAERNLVARILHLPPGVKENSGVVLWGNPSLDFGSIENTIGFKNPDGSYV